MNNFAIASLRKYWKNFGKLEFDSVGKFQPGNPMIAEALEKGEDTTGLCTLRALAEDMIDSKHRECELFWYRKNGDRINVKVEILK